MPKLFTRALDRAPRQGRRRTATVAAAALCLPLALPLALVGATIATPAAQATVPAAGAGRAADAQPARATSRPAARKATKTNCSAKPRSCGYASSTNTGVRRKAPLKRSGSITVTKPGTVIKGLDISGTLTIKASHVTVRNTRVRDSAFSLIHIADHATGVVIKNVDVDGLGLAGTAGSSGIVGGSATIVHTRVTGVENGFVPGSGTRIRRSYVHDLGAPGSPHYDGIQIDGGVHDIAVRHSTIDVTNHDQTSAVMVDNYFGPIARVSVTDNLLMGGGYTVYADGSFSDSARITSVTYADNRMRSGSWGYRLIRNASVDWSHNVVDRTGARISSR